MTANSPTFRIEINENSSLQARKIVWMNEESMNALDIMTSDNIIICSETAETICTVAREKNLDTNTIRITAILSQILHLTFASTVTVKKLAYQRGYSRKITLETDIDLTMYSRDDISALSIKIKENFNKFPIINGDILPMPINGKMRYFITRNMMGNIYEILDENYEITFNYAPKSSIFFSDIDEIGGMHDIAQKIKELMIIPLSHPELYEPFTKKIKTANGVILYGHSGTGKTMFMKTLAKTSKINYIEVTSANIYGKTYGESEQNIKKIFDLAKEKSPTLLFFDEFDAIAPRRNQPIGETEKRVIAQLMIEMDKLSNDNSVIIVAATNQINNIDPSFRRTGRLDYEIHVEPPSETDRLEILQIYTKDMPMRGVKLKEIAKITNGYVGADLIGIIREAVRFAVGRILPNVDLENKIPTEIIKKIAITQKDFLIAVSRIPPSVMRESFIEIPETSMDEIGGLEECKKAIEEAVEWRINPPKELLEIGGQSPKGILLYGSPGCGKTMLGKAVAKKIGVNFFSIKGPELLSKWFGESEKAARDLFEKARSVQPCVIFIDEIDSIAPKRNMNGDDNHTMDRFVNQLLTEIDGVSSVKDIVVMGATNRPDLLDSAILRSGRFDYKIYVPLPDHEARKSIFNAHMNVSNKIKTKGDIDYDMLAKITNGYSGADIEAIIRATIIRAVRNKRDHVTQEDLEFTAKNSVKPTVSSADIEMYENFKRSLDTQNKDIFSKIYYT